MSEALHDPFGWVGSTLDSKYRIDEVVGRGSFGAVYRARHAGLGNVVAIKCVRVPDGLAGAAREDFFEAFIREAKSTQKLTRASFELAEVLDVGVATSPEGATTPYIVMEWIDGHSLAEDIAARPGGRSIAEAVELLAPIARALGAAHSEGLVHRDVKPQNVMLVDGGGAKLMDFGLARVIGEVTPKGAATSVLSLPPPGQGTTTATSFGMTPRYAAPELFKKTYGQAGPWTDVFAFALTFVETVAGKPALAGDDVGELYIASTNLARRPTLRAMGLEVPDALEVVLQRALAVDPKRRHPDVRELWEALVEIARAIPDRAPPAPIEKESSRVPLFVVSAVIALATIGGVVWAAKKGALGGAGAPGGPDTGSPPASTAPPPASTPAAATSPAPRPPASPARVPVDVPVTVSTGAATLATTDGGKVPGMVWVPPGSFEMGGLNTDELPVHKVTLTKGFFLDRTEVTTEDYDACMKAKACTQNRLHNGDEEKPDIGVCHSMKDPSFAKHPINCIDQGQAIAYCKWAGKRLPTEAEWEFAARGPESRAFPWGAGEPTTCAQAILVKMQGACGEHRGTWEVGTTTLGASPFGALDMAGNVWEWTADAFEPYSSAEATDPFVAPKPTTARGVLRGGSWDFTTSALRTGTRYPFWRTSGHMSVGFRCAKDPE